MPAVNSTNSVAAGVIPIIPFSLMNALRRRVGEEERLLKEKDKKIDKLPLLLSKLSAKLRGRPWDPPSSPPPPSSTSKFISSKKQLQDFGFDTVYDNNTKMVNCIISRPTILHGRLITEH
ncbi:hypothetical protein LXL04_036575 [Taraxacum kok-saghyz]